MKANASGLFEDGCAFVGASPGGSATVVEFVDYRRGCCKKAHPEVAGLIRPDGAIRYVIKEFPILGEDSVTASRFAIAANAVLGRMAYEKVHAGFCESYRGAVAPETLSAFAPPGA